MTHPLDPGAPLRHPNGTLYSEEERMAFFADAEERFRSAHRNARNAIYTSALTVGDQLDLLWQELNSTGTISKDGAWFNAVKAVKEAHPKDDSAYQKAVADVAAIRQRNQGA